MITKAVSKSSRKKLNSSPFLVERVTTSPEDRINGGSAVINIVCNAKNSAGKHRELVSVNIKNGRKNHNCNDKKNNILYFKRPFCISHEYVDESVYLKVVLRRCSKQEDRSNASKVSIRRRLYVDMCAYS